jgi:preprotein translocase subunit SecG
MYIFVIIVHVLACTSLILIVLLQKGKGADLGAAFGGASQTVFGGRGAGGFLSKLTTGSAVVFMITSLGLAYLSSHRMHQTVMQEVGRDTSSARARSVQEGAAVPGDKAVPPVQGTEGGAAKEEQSTTPAQGEQK